MQPVDDPDVTVRQAVLADLDALAALFDAYRRFQGRPGDLSAARDFLRSRFDHGESIVFIAHLGSAPAGFAQLYPSFSSVALRRVYVLNDLFVDGSARRRHVASRLLDAVEAYAWSFGASRITLNVARGNTDAQSLYDARGWTRDNEYFMVHRFPPS